MSKLSDAFVDAYAGEMADLDARVSAAPKHTFSAGFEHKMKAAFKAAEHRYVRVSHFRIRRAVLIAILIALLVISSLTALALMKPELIYIIKKNSVAWDIHFKQEGATKDTDKIECVKPETPKEFSITNEQKTDESYSIKYKNEEGKFINYYQIFAEGTGYVIDAEKNNIHKTVIDGHKVLVSKKDGMYQIFFDDGVYLYDINGNGDYDAIKNLAISVIDKL